MYQRGCLAQCTDTGRIENGQINGLFCCNSTLCNTVMPGIETLNISNVKDYMVFEMINDHVLLAMSFYLKKNSLAILF